MIIHWRAHLNSVQNAVGYMMKPTMIMMFAATPVAAVARAVVLVADKRVSLLVGDTRVPSIYTDSRTIKLVRG